MQNQKEDSRSIPPLHLSHPRGSPQTIVNPPRPKIYPNHLISLWIYRYRLCVLFLPLAHTGRESKSGSKPPPLWSIFNSGPRRRRSGFLAPPSAWGWRSQQFMRSPIGRALISRDHRTREAARPKMLCSETRVAVPRKHDAKWLFPQEKATSRTLDKGTFTLV